MGAGPLETDGRELAAGVESELEYMRGQIAPSEKEIERLLAGK